MMLTIKERNERSNLHGAAHASLIGRNRDARNASYSGWDIEGLKLGQRIWDGRSTEDTEGVARRATVVALGRSEGRWGQELHLTVEADRSGEAVQGGLNGLAHITEDQVARTAGRGGGVRDGELEGGRGNGHVARWVVADGVAGRGVKLVAIGAGGSGDDGGAVVRVRLGDLANETSNR